MKEMKKIRYFIYDSLEIRKNDNIIIETFQYDSNTLVYEFYNELYNKYIIANKERIKDDCNGSLTFDIRTEMATMVIDDSNKGLFLSEVIKFEKSIYCIIPTLPIGGIFAIYKNYKIIINSKEENHQRFPHVHVYNQIGEDVVVSLIDLEITGEMTISKKDMRKIVKYIKENKDELIILYNQIIMHKNIGKIEIDYLS